MHPPVGMASYQSKNLTTPRPEFAAVLGPMAIGVCAIASTMPREPHPAQNRSCLTSRIVANLPRELSRNWRGGLEARLAARQHGRDLRARQLVPNGPGAF